MKKTVKLIAIMICLFIALSLVSCKNAEETIKEATAPLNDKIASLETTILSLEDKITELNGQIESIESENEILTAEKAALEEKKADLEKELEELTGEGEDSGETGDPSDPPSHSMLTITGAAFNSESDGYDAETNTFTLDEDTPFILSFEGENFSKLSADNDFMVEVYVDGEWDWFDYIYDTNFDAVTVEENVILYTIGLDLAERLRENYGPVEGFRLVKFGSNEVCEKSVVYVNLTVSGYKETVVVENAEDLLSAFSTYDNIRLGCDIECENGFDVTRDVTLDLAGYDLKVTKSGQATFWIYDSMTIIDSVGGSKLYKGIYLYDAALKISGDVGIFANHHQINGAGSLDLSEYTGCELYLYIERFTDVILSEGYAFYDVFSEEMTDNFEAAKLNNEVYVRPIATEVSTEEEFIAAVHNKGGHVKLTDNITVESDVYTFSDIIIDLGGKTLTFTNDSQLMLHSDRAYIKNGTIECSGYNAALFSYGKEVHILECNLISREYFALYCCDGVIIAESCHFIGAVCAYNSYTDVATIYMQYGNTVEASGSFGICVNDNGVIVTEFDPTDMLDSGYNYGVVTENDDGTYTLACPPAA